MLSYLLYLNSFSVASLISFPLTLISPFCSLGKMGVEWNTFPEIHNVIQDQIAVRFADMTPQRNLFMHLTKSIYSRNY